MSAAAALMLGMGGAPGVINGALPNGAGASPATFLLDTDGTYAISGVAGGNWVNPANATVTARWQVKVDVTAGAFESGTTATWLDIGGSSIWTCDIAGAATATFTISFREKASQLVRSVQAGVTLTATS